jgi:hypothetical protein
LDVPIAVVFAETLPVVVADCAKLRAVNAHPAMNNDLPNVLFKIFFIKLFVFSFSILL